MIASPSLLMQIARNRLSMTAVALALFGCGSLHVQPPPMAIYDLGLGERSALPPTLAPAQIVVLVPPWLESSTMQYRLGWDAPERRRAFAESRWASVPGAMLALVLERTLAQDSASGRCRLRIELDEFVHEFASPERSSTRIVLRAGLLPPRPGIALASREFTVEEPAPTPDARGGARAFRAGAQRLAVELSDWIVTLDRELHGGLNARGRCGA